MSTDGEDGPDDGGGERSACPAPPRMTRAIPDEPLVCAPTAACASASGDAPPPRPMAPRPEPADPIAIPAAPPSPHARVGAWIARHARAGAVGGATGAIVFSLVWLLDTARVVHAMDEGGAVAAVAFVVAIAVGLRFGFAERARAAKERIVRALGLAPFAIAAGASSLLVAVMVDAATRLSEAAAAGVTMAAAVGVLFVTRLARAARPRRADADRRVAPLAWAGLFAAALGVLTAGLFEILHRADAFAGMRGSSQKLLAVGLVALALAFACSRGFTAEGRARIALSRRIAGTTLAALLAAPAILLLVAIAASALDLRSAALGTTLVVAGLAGALVAIAGGRGFVPARPADRVESFVIAGGLLLAASYASSTWVRYALGSGAAADELATELRERGDFERATSYALIACERGVDTACAKASSDVERGRGTRADARLAAKLRAMACDDPEDCLALAEDDFDARDALRRRACELGHSASCRLVALTALQSACEARDVFACRDLAREEDQRPGGASFHAWTRACALGDQEACAHVPR